MLAYILYRLEYIENDRMQQQHGGSTNVQQHVESINEVQRIEGEAARTVEAANEAKERAIGDAKKKAAEIVEKAIASAKEKKQKDISSAAKELEKEKAEALKKAENAASEIKARKLSGEGRERILKGLVSLILGA